MKSQELLSKPASKKLTTQSPKKKGNCKPITPAPCTEVKSALAGDCNLTHCREPSTPERRSAPAEEKAGEHQPKDSSSHQEEQDDWQRVKAARVEAICAKFATLTPTTISESLGDERGAELKQVFAELPGSYQKPREIALYLPNHSTSC